MLGGVIGPERIFGHPAARDRSARNGLGVGISRARRLSFGATVKGSAVAGAGFFSRSRGIKDCADSELGEACASASS